MKFKSVFISKVWFLFALRSIRVCAKSSEKYSKTNLKSCFHFVSNFTDCFRCIGFRLRHGCASTETRCCTRIAVRILGIFCLYPGCCLLRLFVPIVRIVRISILIGIWYLNVSSLIAALFVFDQWNNHLFSPHSPQVMTTLYLHTPTTKWPFPYDSGETQFKL